MSTLAYAALTTRRDEADPGSSGASAPPGLGTWVDALAALVPAEVLGLHALILAFTTRVHEEPGGHAITVVSEPATLAAAFVGLCVVSAAFYVVPRLRDRMWDRLDFLRVAIPPLAFVGWTMLQRSTAFDAIWPQLPSAPRTVIALFLAVLLGLAASLLGYKADQQVARRPAVR
jgi:putative exporter of polyketide antibiotics